MNQLLVCQVIKLNKKSGSNIDKCRKEDFERFILPKQNVREAAVVDRLKVYGAENIIEVIDFLNGVNNLEQTVIDTRTEFAARK